MLATAIWLMFWVWISLEREGKIPESYQLILLYVAGVLCVLSDMRVIQWRRDEN